MADCQFTGQMFHHAFGGEVVADIAKAAGGLEAGLGVITDDAAGFLAPVLQGMQAEGDKVGCIGDADNAKDAAFFFELILIPVVAQV